jgi:hypothetical protein
MSSPGCFWLTLLRFRALKPVERLRDLPWGTEGTLVAPPLSASACVRGRQPFACVAGNHLRARQANFVSHGPEFEPVLPIFAKASTNAPFLDPATSVSTVGGLTW